MEMTILIPYRPSSGGMDSPHEAKPLYQDEDGNWYGSKGRLGDNYRPRLIFRTIKALRKNSIWKHKILLVIDSDMNHNPKWVEKMGDDIEVFKSTYVVPPNCNAIPQTKMLNALKEAIFSRPDNEIVMHSYIVDLVCGKNWDKYVSEAYEQYGDQYVYVAMFVEPRTKHGVNTHICGETVKDIIEEMGPLTEENIWGKWREYCCHALTLKPPTDRAYVKESDLDEWSQVCNRANKANIVEKCGQRKYGYWAPLIARNDKLKRSANELAIGSGGDLAFEGSLGMKVVVTKSHIFHLHVPFELDDIEVEHK